MRKGNIVPVVAAVFLLFCPHLAANGLNLNSLGSRALAMGGAFVGLADDFSTIYWNPAGMAHFRKHHFGFYGTDIIPSSSYTFDMADIEAKTETQHYLAGLAAYYFPLGENMVAGLGIYIPSGLGSLWDGLDFAAVTFLYPYEWESKIGRVTFSPALAYKINQQLYVGAALNINYATFLIKTHAGDQELGVDLGQYEENLKGWGFGATVGILAKPSDKVSLGAAVRTSSKISFSGDIGISKLNVLGMIPGTPLYGTDIPTLSGAERHITWPWWVAGGVAVKPVDNLTLTADLQWTQWSAVDVLESDYDASSWAFIVDAERPMFWKDVLQVRFGGEYTMGTLAFRGGYYWDPSPAPDRTMNVLLPNYNFHGITLGFGYSLDGLNIDMGLEYLVGQKRDIPYAKVSPLSPQYDPDWKTAMPGIYDMTILVPNLSISYKW
jgi:long-chain fatty acid transport protein